MNVSNTNDVLSWDTFSDTNEEFASGTVSEMEVHTCLMKLKKTHIILTIILIITIIIIITTTIIIIVMIITIIIIIKTTITIIIIMWT